MNYTEGANINPLLKDKITIIAAVNKGGWIGKNGDQVWVNSHDRQRFRRLTTGHTVIMGRKTFESIGNKPLKDRVNIVISKTLEKGSIPGVYIARSAADAIHVYNAHGKNLMFVIGGAEIYKMFFPYAGVILLTQAEDETVGDTPLGFKLDVREWKVRGSLQMNKESNGEVTKSHSYITLTRIEDEGDAATH